MAANIYAGIPAKALISMRLSERVSSQAMTAASQAPAGWPKPTATEMGIQVRGLAGLTTRVERLVASRSRIRRGA